MDLLTNRKQKADVCHLPVFWTHYHPELHRAVYYSHTCTLCTPVTAPPATPPLSWPSLWMIPQFKASQRRMMSHPIGTLSQLASWFTENNLEFIVDKTVEIVVGFHKESTSWSCVLINNAVVKEVGSLLGTTVSSNLKWEINYSISIIKRTHQSRTHLRLHPQFTHHCVIPSIVHTPLNRASRLTGLEPVSIKELHDARARNRARNHQTPEQLYSFQPQPTLHHPSPFIISKK